jgi:CubicO group peptidase (beta-lactamase class C family)
VLALAWCISVGAAGSTQRGCGDVLTDAEATLDQWRLDAGVPSLVVVVGHRGRIVFEHASGWADQERRLAATPSTPYSLASLSKPITATAVMTLVEQGRFRLDDPISALLPETPLLDRTDGDAARRREPTVRHLLTHTAGLPLHHHFFDGDRGRAPPPMVTTIARYGFLVAPPGARYQYSNLGYGILDHLVEQQTGDSFGRFLQAQVFDPIGMTDASVGPPPGRNAAVRYARDGRPLPFYDVDHRGGSALFASARDIARFGLAHLGTPVAGSVLPLSRRTARAMRQPDPSSARVGPGGYGLGWQVARRQEQLVVSHGGGMPGVSTQLALLPDDGLVVVALSNASTPLPQRVVDDIAARFRPLPPIQAQLRPIVMREAGQEPRAQRHARALQGVWLGAVHADGNQQPMGLYVPATGAAQLCLGGRPPSALHGSGAADEVAGLVLQELETTDTAGVPHRLYVRLGPFGDRLAGVVTAIARDGEHPGFALSHWADLRAVPALDDLRSVCGTTLPATGDEDRRDSPQQ